MVAVFAVVEFAVRYSGLWQKTSHDQRRYFCGSSVPGVPYMLEPGIQSI